MRLPSTFIPSGGFARWPGNVQGAAWMLASCAGFSLMVALVKATAREINSFEITFFRCFSTIYVARREARLVRAKT